jgi:hypothetical protein
MEKTNLQDKTFEPVADSQDVASIDAIIAAVTHS